MDASRLERAARALVERLDEMFVGPTTRAQVEELRAALAAQPAQAGEAVAWAARDGFGKVVVLEPTERRAKAQSVRRALEIGGGPLPVFPLYTHPTPRAQAVAWAGVQALIDSADKCADMMDAQECPVSSGGEEWDAALCELRERADAVRAARIDAWHPTPRAEAASVVPAGMECGCCGAKAGRPHSETGCCSLHQDGPRLFSATASVPSAAPASAEAVAREAAREAVRLADSDRGDGATSMSEDAIVARAVAHALRAKVAR